MKLGFSRSHHILRYCNFAASMRSLKLYLLSVSLFAALASNAGEPPVGTESILITKQRLVHIIDSILDLEKIEPQHLELIEYYASILKTYNADTVRIQGINLNALNFYSEHDEHALFPVKALSAMPSHTTLIIENGHLSFFSMPYGGVVTSNYGWREGKMHQGIDIDLNKGDKVVAAFDGKVRIAKLQGGYGNVVVLMHPNGLETVYAHLSKIKVKAGDVVRSGELLGLGGNTGRSTGSHLHFEIRYQGYALNPATIVSFTEKKLIYHTITIQRQNDGLAGFPSNCHLHRVQKGETWPLIAERYGKSLQELLALNGTGKKYYLKAGQQVRVD